MPEIIIPILNEEAILTQESDYYKDLSRKTRIIFVDGGSTDHTVEIAQNYGEVILSSTGRGMQKNRGAEESNAHVLLFLHVDSFISDNALKSIDRAIRQGASGGCLTMRIQDKGLLFRLYELIVNFRAKMFGIIDGDLGMFIRRDIFEQLGGFDFIPVMEDLIFSKKLSKKHSVHVLLNPIDVSARKWHDHGFIKTFLSYTCAYIKLWTGQIKSNHLNTEVV